MNKNFALIAAVIVISAAVVLACGCVSPGEQPGTTVNPTPTKEPENVYRFNETSNKGTFAVPLDAEIWLTLPGNPTTGYTWQLSTTPGVVIENESYLPDDPSGKLVGSGGTYLWVMKAVMPGTQVITGDYARPWESNKTDSPNFTLTLNVGEVLTPPGAPPRYPVYTLAANGSAVQETLGDEFNVRLEENPTTGYSWNMTSTDGLALVSDQYIPSQPSGTIVGAGGVHSYFYKAVMAGDQGLHGEYRRPWVPAGTITYVSLEGGFFGIVGDDGKNYLPLNLDKQYEQDGLRVAFEYEPVKDVATIQMWGEPVNLTFIEPIRVFDLSVHVT
jgi:inhibitor of cysteine peptidase